MFKKSVKVDYHKKKKYSVNYTDWNSPIKTSVISHLVGFILIDRDVLSKLKEIPHFIIGFLRLGIKIFS